MKPKIKGLIPTISGGILLVSGFAMSQSVEYKLGDKDSRQAAMAGLLIGVVLLGIGLFRLIQSVTGTASPAQNTVTPKPEETPKPETSSKAAEIFKNINTPKAVKTSKAVTVKTTPPAATASLFCNKCGASLPPESAFCNKCGAPAVK